MAGAKLAKEITVKTPNKVGMLAEVAAAIAEKGVNITGINAYAAEGDAFFRLITADNARAAEALKAKGFLAQEKDVVVVPLADRAGAAKDMGAKLKAAGIDIVYIYGTTCLCEDKCDPSCKCQIVFNSKDNKKALEALNK